MRQHKPERCDEARGRAAAAAGAPQGVAVARIASKELVPTVSRQGNGDRLARELGDQESRDGRRVGERLIEHRGDALENLLHIRSHHEIGVLGTQMRRHGPRGSGLVVLLLGKTD